MFVDILQKRKRRIILLKHETELFYPKDSKAKSINRRGFLVKKPLMFLFVFRFLFALVFSFEFVFCPSPRPPAPHV